MTTPTTPVSYQMSRDKIREALDIGLSLAINKQQTSGKSHSVVIGKFNDALALLDAEAPVYSMSRDYEALYEHLKAGGEALGQYDRTEPQHEKKWLQGVWLAGPWKSKHMLNGAFFGELVVDDATYERQAFLAECQRLNLEWISPVAPAKTVSLEDLVEIVDAEPELPDDMPDEMWEACSGDRTVMQEALRVVVRLTKEGISSRLSSLLDQKKEQDGSGVRAEDSAPGQSGVPPSLRSDPATSDTNNPSR